MKIEFERWLKSASLKSMKINEINRRVQLKDGRRVYHNVSQQSSKSMKKKSRVIKPCMMDFFEDDT